MKKKVKKKRIKELEKRVEKLEAKKEEEEKKEKVGESPARGVLKAFGLGGVVDALKGSKELQERLNEIDKKVEEEFRKAPEDRGRKIVRVERGLSIRPIRGKRRYKSMGAYPKKQEVKKVEVEPEKIKGKEPLVDVFDEKNCLRVVAQLPGAKEKDIKTVLGKKTLTISAKTGKHEYYKKITLPCPVKGKVKKSFKNSVLELELPKPGLRRKIRRKKREAK